jgi:hypothetical protein
MANQLSTKSETGAIKGTVIDTGPKGHPNNPVHGAEVILERAADKGYPHKAVTEEDGSYIAHVPPGTYKVSCPAFGATPESRTVDVVAGREKEVNFKVEVGLTLTVLDREGHECTQIVAGNPATFRAEYDLKRVAKDTELEWVPDRGKLMQDTGERNEVLLLTEGVLGKVNVKATLRELGSPSITATGSVNVLPAVTQHIGGQLGVTLRRSDVPLTKDVPLWIDIRNTRLNYSGSGYQTFIDNVLGLPAPGAPPGSQVPDSLPGSAVLKGQLISSLPFVYGVGAYELLKTATQVFLLLEAGVASFSDTNSYPHQRPFDAEEESARLGEPVTQDKIRQQLTLYLSPNHRLPYLERVIAVAFPDEDKQPPATTHSYGLLKARAVNPSLIELIWSYWHEEGMLVQTMAAITRRFQNVRGPGDRDPLAHLEIDPLRPLNNLLWGYVQDEWNRLTLQRRAYEYDHEYGLAMYGKAVPTLRTADSRSKFVEAFHHLLHLCSVFYKEDNDTTVIADGFPLLNALKEVHLVLAQGAHNQFGDLPWTARTEMLMQQWLLARPEMRDFLQSRPMVPYKEPWMPQVDTMKTLQGWSNVTVTHFRDLGVYGEQILLSIRYGDWIGINDENYAKNWARYWRPEVQGYLHAYRAVAGVDLTNPDTVDTTMPSIHLQKRLATQRVR